MSIGFINFDFCFFFLGSLEPTVPEEFNEARRPSFLDAMGSVDPNSPAMKALIQLSTKPKKSILKKTNSFTIHGMGDRSRTPIPSFTDDSSWKKRFHTLTPGQSSNYKTVTGAETPIWKNALDSLGSMLGKKPSHPDVGANVSVMAMAAGNLRFNKLKYLN